MKLWHDKKAEVTMLSKDLISWIIRCQGLQKPVSILLEIKCLPSSARFGRSTVGQINLKSAAATAVRTPGSSLHVCTILGAGRRSARMQCSKALHHRRFRISCAGTRCEHANLGGLHAHPNTLGEPKLSLHDPGLSSGISSRAPASLCICRGPHSPCIISFASEMPSESPVSATVSNHQGLQRQLTYSA